MDEVDGMSAGDRGGMAALISLIKTTRVPIICLCNDRQDPKACNPPFCPHETGAVWHLREVGGGTQVGGDELLVPG